MNTQVAAAIHQAWCDTDVVQIAEHAERSARRPCSASSIVPTLAGLLESALGSDPWAVGHRSAALAFAATVIDVDEFARYRGTIEGARFAETTEVLDRYLRNRSDVRGFRTD